MDDALGLLRDLFDVLPIAESAEASSAEELARLDAVAERVRAYLSTRTEAAIEHEPTEDCGCNPTIVPVERDDGSIGWVYVHHGGESQ